MATKRVKAKGFPDPIIINEEDFDPSVHKEVAETVTEGEGSEPAPNLGLKGKLPDDFPGFAALEAAGVTTYGQARKVTDWTTIKGVGVPTAEKIKIALAAKPEAEDEA